MALSSMRRAAAGMASLSSVSARLRDAVLVMVAGRLAIDSGTIMALRGPFRLRTDLRPASKPAMPEPVLIRPVTTNADRTAFVDLVWEVYRDDPAWVPPLKSEVH